MLLMLLHHVVHPHPPFLYHISIFFKCHFGLPPHSQPKPCALAGDQSKIQDCGHICQEVNESGT